jgi:uncharacterized protein
MKLGQMTPTPDSIFVLDTNVLVASFAPNSRHKIIIQQVLVGGFQLAVSSSIVLEYEEVLARKFNLEAVDDFLKALLNLPSVHLMDPEFNMNLIQTDPDDNKFVDCAFAANAAANVSNDRHFAVLRALDFPQIGVISLTDFMELLQSE